MLLHKLSYVKLSVMVQEKKGIQNKKNNLQN